MQLFIKLPIPITKETAFTIIINKGARSTGSQSTCGPKHVLPPGKGITCWELCGLVEEV